VKYIPTYHPKHSVPPTPTCVAAALSRPGWIAQEKIDGWRAQVHVGETRINAFTRIGNPLALPLRLQQELRAELAPGQVVEGEWVSMLGRLYLFDMIAVGGEVLRRDTYLERYARLPSFRGDLVVTLPILESIEQVMAVLSAEDDLIEGVVFKDSLYRGFSDTSVQRCRRYGHRHSNFRRPRPAAIA